MANSMMDSILGMVTPEMKQALASRLGTSAQTAEGALGAATAATLGGLATKAASERRTRAGSFRGARMGWINTSAVNGSDYSTVTVFARLRGWSTFRPRALAMS